MATPNQMNSGVVDRKSYAIMYNKLFDEIKMKVEEVDFEAMQFFSERNWSQEVYREGEATRALEMPMVNEDTDRIPLMVPAEGFYKEWTSVNYRSGFIISEDAITMQKQPIIVQMMTGLPESFRNKQELLAMNIFDNGFTTELTGDGLSVWNTAHLHEDNQSGTYSNRAASGGAFTTTTYFTAWLNFQTRVNEKLFSASRKPAKVAYPVQIHEAVMKVFNSDLYPQNALNAKLDKLFKDYTPIPLHNLTSQTAWFVFDDSPEMKRGFLMVWRVRPNYRPISDSMNPDLIMGRRGKMSVSAGALHARDSYGNAGA